MVLGALRAMCGLHWVLFVSRQTHVALGLPSGTGFPLVPDRWQREYCYRICASLCQGHKLAYELGHPPHFVTVGDLGFVQVGVLGYQRLVTGMPWYAAWTWRSLLSAPDGLALTAVVSVTMPCRILEATGV